MFKPNLKEIPINSGVYIYKDINNNIIYIGKAKNLKNRISSYFNSNHNQSNKTKILVKNIANLEYIIVDNEIEALLLENKLIKKHKPKYNINLKDSKTYAYICITNEKIPQIKISRIKNNKDLFFGPYTSSTLRNEIIEITQKLFNIISKKTYSNKSQLNYQINLAPAKNIKEINPKIYKKNVEDAINFLNGKNINSIINKLKNQIQIESNKLNYEIALEKQKQIDAILKIKEKQKVDLIKNYNQDIIVIIEDKKKENALIVILNIQLGTIGAKKEFKFSNYNQDLFEEFIKMYYSKNEIPKEIITNYKFENQEEQIKIIEEYLIKLNKKKTKIIIPKKGEKLKLVELAITNAKDNFQKNNILIQLKEKLKLMNTPIIIDCFDMSNLGYDYLVGACTRFVNEKEEKDSYRKFNIKSFSGKNDDYLAMDEVLTRRYKMILEKKDPVELPNLIIIDGGLGQLKIAKQVLKKLNLLKTIDLISIAKGEKRDKNEIYTIYNNTPIILNDKSKEILYLSKIRDSVHNFVINFNRKKRNKKLEEQFRIERKKNQKNN